MKNRPAIQDSKRILGVFAHPDDESFCAGGTFAKYVATGAEVMVVSATRGEAGQIRMPSVATRLYYSYFPPQRQLLLEQLVQWLVQVENGFRGTLEFAYVLL